MIFWLLAVAILQLFGVAYSAYRGWYRITGWSILFGIAYVVIACFAVATFGWGLATGYILILHVFSLGAGMADSIEGRQWITGGDLFVAIIVLGLQLLAVATLA